MKAEGVDLNKLFEVSFLPTALHSAHACKHSLADATAPAVMANSAMHNSTESTIDTSAVLAEIGAPMSMNAMPDPHAVNAAMSSECDTSHFYDAKGNINALSTNNLIMMFFGLLAVSDDLLPARILADTGATHCLISEKLVHEANLHIQPVHNWLSLPSGAQIMSKGTAVVTITIQSYKANVTCFVLPMSDQFDMIFGQDWLKHAKCNIDYETDRLTCTDHAGRKHTLLSQEHDADVICPIVSAMH